MVRRIPPNFKATPLVCVRFNSVWIGLEALRGRTRYNSFSLCVLCMSMDAVAVASPQSDLPLLVS
jgi:hypothetical protein